jgi:hypothetical protein
MPSTTKRGRRKSWVRKKEETGWKRAVSGHHHEVVCVSTTVRAGSTKRAQGHNGGGADRLKEPSSCLFYMARRSLPSRRLLSLSSKEGVPWCMYRGSGKGWVPSLSGIV